jgi:hypothetical protein
MRKSRFFAVVLVAGAVLAAALAFQAIKVSMNGKVVTSTGRMINGSLYVKLADVAKALDLKVVGKGSAYELVPAGGANMLQGTKGKLGEELFTGKWKFTVTGVQRVDKYMLQYADSKFEHTANPGSDLVVVSCRFKNAVNQTVFMYFNGLGNTSLTDMNEQVYKPLWMDSAGGVALDMLPGSAKDFAILFRVPKTAELKDLVYTVEPVNSAKYGVTHLRISLKP